MRRTGLSCAPTLAGLSVAFGLCGTPGASAQAQTAPSLDLRTWRPSPDPRANLILEPVTTPGSWQWSVGAWAQYAEDPVILRAPTGVEVRPVAHLLAADFVACVGLGDRASVGLDVPAFLWQEGAGGLSSGIVGGGKAPTTGLGDVSAVGKVTLVSDDRQGVLAGWGLAVLGAASIPTGNRAGFESDGALGISLRLLAEYALAVGEVRAVLGYSARSERTWPEAPDGTTFGNAIPWAIGGILRPKALAPALDPGDRQQWEIAAHGELPAGPVAPFGLGGAGGGGGGG
ncbi:MAG TPA: hypothetical protein VH137_10765, partial [Gemmatimonadales bacterium]|nr:hypothetical protein [Gemmatimonadales bacterium]